MTTANAAEHQKTTATTTSQDAVLKMILGVAIFDLSGLPREYFVTHENNSTHLGAARLSSIGAEIVC
jgi:hypothetical protein